MNKDIAQYQKNPLSESSAVHTSFSTRLVPWLLILGTALLFFTCCWKAYWEPPIYNGEYHILLHAREFLKGAELPMVKYPPFPLLFHALFLFLAQSFTTNILQVGRVANLGLLLLNFVLFYRVSVSVQGVVGP